MTFKPKNTLPNGMSKNMDQGKLTRPTRLSAKVPKIRNMRGPDVDAGKMRSAPPRPSTPKVPKPISMAGPGFTSGASPTEPMTPGYSKGGMVQGVPHVANKVMKTEC